MHVLIFFNGTIKGITGLLLNITGKQKDLIKIKRFLYQQKGLKFDYKNITELQIYL